MWPFTSSKRLNREAELIGRADHYATQAAEADATAKGAVDNLARAAQKHSRFARIVAQHIVAAEYPGLKNCDVDSAGIALAEAVESAGIDLSIELSRLRKDSPRAGREPLFIDGASTAPLSLARRLELSERARAALAEQLAQMQAANDAMCRDAVTAAGTLARVEVADA